MPVIISGDLSQRDPGIGDDDLGDMHVHEHCLGKRIVVLCDYRDSSPLKSFFDIPGTIDRRAGDRHEQIPVRDQSGIVAHIVHFDVLGLGHGTVLHHEQL